MHDRAVSSDQTCWTEAENMSDRDPTPAASSRAGNILLVLLSPAVLCWTGYAFWQLATRGRMWVRENGLLVEASGGFNFGLTLGLYVLLTVGALVVLATFAGWLRARLRGGA